jgi:hypothetical protein
MMGSREKLASMGASSVMVQIIFAVDDFIFV